jgi:hypothetical protein
MAEQHPQPLFDFLKSLPVPVEDSFLQIWHDRIDGVEKGASVEEYPELWEYQDFPDFLKKITTEDYVSFLYFDGLELNLNAIAIGLGLDNVEYEPRDFAGLIYHSSEVDVPVVCNGAGIIVSVSRDEKLTKKGVTSTVEKIDGLGLLDPPAGWVDEIHTKKVGVLVSSEE